MFPTIVNLLGILLKSNNEFEEVNRLNLTIMTSISYMFLEKKN